MSASAAGPRKVYYSSVADHSLALCLRGRGWEETSDARAATVVLPAKGEMLPGPVLAHQWVWASGCLSLACKAQLFERLARVFERRDGARRRWPETWVLKSRGCIDAWSPDAGEDDAVASAGASSPRYFVKHPRAGGGQGTFAAASARDARALAASVLEAAQDAVVVQRAVAPATLPKGPSYFEMRVFGLLRRADCRLFARHRAKTATSGLMNKKVQKDLDSFGRFYPYNIASEDELRDALGDAYDRVTRPEIAACVALVHSAVRSTLPNGAFVFVGFDFIVDTDARPWLIEANVKPAWRYANLIDQFQSPVVRDLAVKATCDLARIVDGHPDDDEHEASWLRVTDSDTAGRPAGAPR